MGRRGPLKLPDHLKVVTPLDRDESDTAAAVVEPIAPTKPAAVSADRDLSRLWDQIVPELDKDGLLSRSDAMALELCLRHFVLARRASNKAKREGLSTVDKAHGGTKKNPAEAVFRAESSMFLRYAQQLGLTFAGRARTPAPDAEPDDGQGENPFA